MLAQLILLLALPAGAEILPPGWKAIVPQRWGGLNLLQDSAEIDGDCQDCQNILTDNGYLEKRPGNVLLTTVLSSFTVSYVGEWVSPSNTRYLIAQSSTSIYQTSFSGSPVVIATITKGYNLTTAPAFSKLYFADGIRALMSWDGTTFGTVTDANSNNAPDCTYVAYKDARIYCANIPSQSSSRVRISSQGGAGYFTVPANSAQVDNAPQVFDFNPDDGDSINCLAATPWGVFVGKRYSTHWIKGTGNLTFNLRVLDPKIGCVDNRQVQMVYGKLTWLATDGWYQYDGAGAPQLISRAIDPLIANIRASTYADGVWSTQLKVDWQTGTQSTDTLSLPLFPWDSTTTAGSIMPSSFTIFDDNTSSGPGVVSFTYDTLSGIDTTTAPGNASVGGYAAMLPSTAGVSVWSSTFTGSAADNYTTAQTTWTKVSSSHCKQDGAVSAFPGNGNALFGGTYNIEQNCDIYTTAPTYSSGPTNGWNFGSWRWYWSAWWHIQSLANYYGTCFGTVNTLCAEYHFIANKAPGSSWNGYGVDILANQCYPPGSQCAMTLKLYKALSGTKTTLGTGIFYVAEDSVDTISTSTQINITRTPGGYMTVSVGTVTYITVTDNDATASAAGITEMILYSHVNADSSWVSTSYSSAAYLNGYGLQDSIVSQIFDTGQGAPLAGNQRSTATLTGDGATAISFNVRNSTSPNNDMWTSWQASSNNVVPSLNLRYWQWRAIFTTSAASETPKLTSFALNSVTTGYYYSKVFYVGTQITSWKQFNVTEANPGTYNYAVRAASWAFASNDQTVNWSTQTANQNINASTGAYAQYRTDSTSLANADKAEPISGVFVRWANGTYIPTASAALDRRYYTCVTVSTSATVPDTCMVYQRNGKWVYWKGPSVGALGIYNYNVVAADGGTTGKVWRIMQPGVYNDDGAAIDGYWVTADYTNGTLFNLKTLHEIWFDAVPIQNSSVTVSYQNDKSGTWTDSTQFLDNGNGINPTSLYYSKALLGSINRWVPLTAGYTVGKYFRLKFEDNQLGNLYRINNYALYVQDEPRSVYPP